MNRAADALRPAFTARQGQFLVFIHAYTNPPKGGPTSRTVSH
jgi:hypothetical protein